MGALFKDGKDGKDGKDKDRKEGKDGKDGKEGKDGFEYNPLIGTESRHPNPVLESMFDSLLSEDDFNEFENNNKTLVT